MSIFDYNDQIQKFFNEKIKVSREELEKLKTSCESNEDRIINRLNNRFDVSRSSFVNQGSYAMKTLISEEDNSYDIDDALIVDAVKLKDRYGNDLSTNEFKSIVLESLEDSRFTKSPQKLRNCIRVYYNEGYHVDVACLRRKSLSWGTIIELASTNWKESNPKQINDWFSSKVQSYNEIYGDGGTILRRMIRYLKKFARSRTNWDMPCGLILTMLAVECFVYYKRDDECLYYLLKSIYSRLNNHGLIVQNLADGKEILTKSLCDPDMIELKSNLKAVLDKLEILEDDNCKAEDARGAWTYLFNNNGFFKKEDDILIDKANMIKKGEARTSSKGNIGLIGIKNLPHKFHGI